MPLAVAIPIIISGVKALLRFRGQIDTVLSVNETTTGLQWYKFMLTTESQLNTP